MNVLFMIGNGFDLNCGMKTKYSDVYNEYIKTKSESRVIADFKKTIESNLDTLIQGRYIVIMGTPNKTSSFFALNGLDIIAL